MDGGGGGPGGGGGGGGPLIVGFTSSIDRQPENQHHNRITPTIKDIPLK